MLTFELPYGMSITSNGQATRIDSHLRDELVDSCRESDPYGELATHAVESVLVALVAEGIDLSSVAGRSAVHAAVQHIAEYLVRLEE
jgi:hypothetical protein